MQINEKNLAAAVEAGIISAEQAERLYQFFQTQNPAQARFDFTHVLYYLGGLLAIGAMSLFMTLGWEAFGGWGIFAIAIIYALLGLKLSQFFDKKGYLIPAGICATFTVALTPLAVYGLQQALGLWTEDSVYRDYHRYIQWQWLYMELATLVVGVIIAWRYRYPFLIMPIAVTLWYLSMDISALISGNHLNFTLKALVSMYFGLLVALLAFWVDVRSRHTLDYAFWLYIFGVLAFWIGLSSQHSDNELAKFMYFCINLLMIAVGVLLVRRIFVILGALGSCFYLGYLAFDVFEDSWLFPFVLTAIGLLVIYGGILWQKNEQALTERARSVLPQALRELLQTRD